MDVVTIHLASELAVPAVAVPVVAAAVPVPAGAVGCPWCCSSRR